MSQAAPFPDRNVPATTGAEPDPLSRDEERAAEARVNLARLAALIAFYGYHLVNVFENRADPALAGTYHLAATALATVWAVGVLALYLALALGRPRPPSNTGPPPATCCSPPPC